MDKREANAILVMNCPTALASSTEAAEAVIGAVDKHKHNSGVPPILTNWLGADAAAEARAKFQAADIPSYESPRDAIKGFGFLWQYAKAQAALMRTPPREADLSGIDRTAALDAMREAARAKRALLTEPEAKAVLAAYGIPTVPTSIAASPQEVERDRRSPSSSRRRTSPSRCCPRTSRINRMSAACISASPPQPKRAAPQRR